MASRFSISGWRTSTIAPKAVAPTAMPAATPLAALGTTPATAGNFATPPQRKLNDPTLASAGYRSTIAGAVQPYFAESVYQRPEVPAFLAQAVSDLNTGQSLQRSIQSEWNNKILAAAGNKNDPNAYLYQNALQAASVSPGAHVSFGQAVQSPLIGQGYQTAAQGAATLANAQASAAYAPTLIQGKIEELQRKKSRLPTLGFGVYQNSPQQEIDRQISNLQDQFNGAYTASAGNNRPTSGWNSPQLPY